MSTYYRNREREYPVPTDPELAAMRVYFYTHQPAEWRTNGQAREDFAAIYDEDALAEHDRTGKVPENHDRE